MQYQQIKVKTFQLVSVFKQSYVLSMIMSQTVLKIYFHLSWFSWHERRQRSKWQIHSSQTLSVSHFVSLCLSLCLSVCIQVPRAVTYSSTTCHRSSETMSSCRCFCPSAQSSPLRSSWTEQPTRASALVSYSQLLLNHLSKDKINCRFGCTGLSVISNI